jgi:hypothetical protein
VTILLPSQRNGGAWSCLQTRATVGLSLRCLSGFAHQISREESVRSTIWRKQVDHEGVSKARGVALDVATDVTRCADIRAVGSNHCQLFNPGMTVGRGGEEEEEGCKPVHRHLERGCVCGFERSKW